MQRLATVEGLARCGSCDCFVVSLVGFVLLFPWWFLLYFVYMGCDGGYVVSEREFVDDAVYAWVEWELWTWYLLQLTEWTFSCVLPSGWLEGG